MGVLLRVELEKESLPEISDLNICLAILVEKRQAEKEQNLFTTKEASVQIKEHVVNLLVENGTANERCLQQTVFSQGKSFIPQLGKYIILRLLAAQNSSAPCSSAPADPYQ